MGQWHKIDVALAKRQYEDGWGLAEIAQAQGVSTSTVLRHLSNAGVHVVNEGAIKQKIRYAILSYLDQNGPHVASDIDKRLKNSVGNGFIWPNLLALEREGLVWRAYDYEDWRTLHLWKLTGCGRLLSAGLGQSPRSTP